MTAAPKMLVHPAYHEVGVDDEDANAEAAPAPAMPVVERTSLLDSVELNNKWRWRAVGGKKCELAGAPSAHQLNDLEMCSHVVNVMFKLLEADLANEACENSERLTSWLRGGVLEAVRIANDRIAAVADELHGQRDRALALASATEGTRLDGEGR